MEEELKAVREAEIAICKALLRCDSIDDVAAVWVALSKSMDDSARIRIEELGGNVERVRAALDSFSLYNPI